MSRTHARLLVLAASVLFSTGGAAVKTGAFTTVQVSGIRSAIAAAALLAALRGRTRLSGPGIATSLAYAATVTLFVAASRLTTAASAIFLQSTAPLYLLVLGPLLLGEHAHRRDIPYLVVLAAGMALCFAGQPSPTATAPRPDLGNALGALSGLTWALTLAGLRRAGRAAAGRDAGVSIAAVGNVFACLATLPWLAPLPSASLAEWATLVYLGVFQLAVAYLCLVSAVVHVPAFEAALILLVEPVLNPLWTWLLRDEKPGSWTMAGGAIILAATLVRTTRTARLAAGAGV